MKKSLKLVFRFVFLVLASMAFQTAANAQLTIFTTDFDDGVVPEFSGPGFLDDIQGFAGTGPVGNTFTGQFLRNTTVGPSVPSTLTLVDLPVHTHVDLSFLLAILESWDGGGNVPGAAPDLFGVRVDGVTVFQHSFDTTGVSPQSYNAPVDVVIFELINVGNFGHGFPESAYALGLESAFQSIEHTSSTLVVEWFAEGAGWQGGNDESWAIDNVAVTLTGTTILGDVNLDGVVNLLDVQPFVELLTSEEYQTEADTNQDGFLNLLDVQPFVDLLAG